MTKRIHWLSAVVELLTGAAFMVSCPMWLPELIGGTQHQMFVLRFALWCGAVAVMPLMVVTLIVAVMADYRERKDRKVPNGRSA